MAIIHYLCCCCWLAAVLGVIIAVVIVSSDAKTRLREQQRAVQHERERELREQKTRSLGNMLKVRAYSQ